ncbi:hypothetical protein KAT24_01545, partial [Candidatus Pacearchaeota archaeon]|nr:hypothetical protein [Candidatus Pacearchaeota archaeon]
QLDAETKQESNLETTPQPNASESQGFNFLGGMASAAKTEEPGWDVGAGDSEVDERKKKLAKRFMDMTNKIEDLSNQIYHLQQRIEVLERKSGIRIE